MLYEVITFYMGINLGSFLSPLIIGTVGMKNFHLGFGLAGVGMFIGLILYVTTRKKNLGLAGTSVVNPLSSKEKKKVFTKIGIGIVVIGVLIAIAIPLGIP